jgi:hypothetical protein
MQRRFEFGTVGGETLAHLVSLSLCRPLLSHLTVSFNLGSCVVFWFVTGTCWKGALQFLYYPERQDARLVDSQSSRVG